MINFTSLLQTPELMLAFIISLLFIVVLGVALTIILIDQKNCRAKLGDIAISLSNLSDGIVRVNLHLEAFKNKLRSLEIQYTEFAENYERTKVELARLAQNMGGESQLTKAIDLARGGANAKEIVLATSLGNDEAQAIVKFHGSVKR